jgi:carbonic anhydrase/acetyltransferase-like protein (isoleucine patch superfamily)
MSLFSLNGVRPQVHEAAFADRSAQISGDVKIGAESSVWPLCVLRGDVSPIVIGKQTNLQDGTIIHATGGISSVHVGDRCTIGHRAILHGCTVGNDCLVGMGAILLDNVIVGDGCFVAAGALIPPGKTFQPGSFIMGAPAKRVRLAGDKERMVIDASWRVYVELMQLHRGAVLCQP